MEHALKRFRLLTETPAAAIASAVGTTRQTIYRIEKREQTPSLDLVDRLIAVSGGKLSADDFLPSAGGIPCALNDAEPPAASIHREAVQ